jgi:hypothetical protein
MAEQNERRDLAKTDSGLPRIQPTSSPNLINLGSLGQLDVTGLSSEQVAELRMAHANSMVDLQKKALELKIDVTGLDAQVGSMVDHARKATESGTHLTGTLASKSTIGTSEYIIGNTETAGRGKLTNRQAGAPDRTLIYIIVAAAAAIVVALIIAHGGR